MKTGSSDTLVTYRLARTIVAVKARNTAAPPIRGMGIVWTFRTIGISIAPRDIPSILTNGVRPRENPNAIANNINTVIIMVTN